MLFNFSLHHRLASLFLARTIQYSRPQTKHDDDDDERNNNNQAVDWMIIGNYDANESICCWKEEKCTALIWAKATWLVLNDFIVLSSVARQFNLSFHFTLHPIPQPSFRGLIGNI